MKNQMKCFISLPIAGKEDTVFERANKAKEEVKQLGFIPVSPLDLNEINNDNIDGHGDKVAFYMGKDIETLINCDAIYSCNGWEYSKGCQVERKCAKVYGKIIINQRKDLFSEKIENKFEKVWFVHTFDIFVCYNSVPRVQRGKFSIIKWQKIYLQIICIQKGTSPRAHAPFFAEKGR